MYWIHISILLAIVYSLYILFSQCLITKFHLNPKTIFINIICIAAVFSLFTNSQQLIVPQFNLKYGLICIVGFLIFLQNYLLQLGTQSSTNMGIIDAFAICMYIPIVTFGLYLFYNEKITIRKACGIALACVSSYFILT
tara:strand:+ start:207 stop:623 length:417 start_codon:yes stop_codon:yes gene_type:complete